MTKRQKERLSNLYKLMQTGGIAAAQLGGVFLVAAVDFATMSGQHAPTVKILLVFSVFCFLIGLITYSAGRLLARWHDR
jgi:hypothetical protein